MLYKISEKNIMHTYMGFYDIWYETSLMVLLVKSVKLRFCCFLSILGMTKVRNIQFWKDRPAAGSGFFR